MRRVASCLWSSLSVAIGVLRAWPAALPVSGLGRLQAWAREDPALGLLAGIAGVRRALCGRRWAALMLSLLGVGLNAWPWLRRGAASETMAAAMRQGLGLGWQRAIPADVHRSLRQSHRTDLWGALRSLWPMVRVSQTRDVLFGAPDGQPLRLDVFQPPAQDGLRPALLVLRPHSWADGAQASPAWSARDRWLAAQGYVVFDAPARINAPWPAPLADVKCAIRWIKANASRYGVDAERVAVLGRGAGGYLALMAAYTPDDPSFPATCFRDVKGVDDRVQAVIASGAPTDLRLWLVEYPAVEAVLGGSPESAPSVYEQAATVTHVTPDAPPTLLIHAADDPAVPPVQAGLLAERLREAGAPVVLLRVPGHQHNADGLLFGLAGSMLQYDVDRFMAWAFNRERKV